MGTYALDRQNTLATITRCRHSNPEFRHEALSLKTSSLPHSVAPDKALASPAAEMDVVREADLVSLAVVHREDAHSAQNHFKRTNGIAHART